MRRRGPHGPPEGAGSAVTTCVGSSSTLGSHAGITRDENTTTKPSPRQGRPSSPPSRNQPGFPQAPPGADPCGAVCRGAGGAARIVDPPPKVYLVPTPPAARAAPLGLRRAAERDLPLPGLPRVGRLD